MADVLDGEEGMYLEQGYIPSVTTILGIIKTEHIERWKREQCIKFFVDSKLKPTKKDVRIAATHENKESSEFGKVCHAIVANICQGLHLEDSIQKAITPLHEQCAAPVVGWWKENVAHGILAEHSFIDHDLGFSGTLDALCVLNTGEYLLCDFKFKKDRKKYPMHAGLDYRMQLCAYRKAISKELGIPYKDIRIGNILGAAPFADDWVGPRVDTLLYEPACDWYNEFEALMKVYYAFRTFPDRD